MSLQHLQSVCDFYYLFYKASHWYCEVLDRLKDSLWDQMPMKENETSSMVQLDLLWRRQSQALLSQMPPQNPDEWMELAKLSSLFPEVIKTKAMQLSSRCILLWNILTSHTMQVCPRDLQQVMSWKQTLGSFTPSPYIHLLHTSQNSISENPRDHVREKSLRLCEQKHLNPIRMQGENVPVGETDYLTHGKCSNSVDEPTNPWLSLPLMSFFSGCERQHNYKGRKSTFIAHKQIKNEFTPISTATHKTNVELSYRSKAVQVSDTKRTYRNCGIQTDNHQSFNINEMKTPRIPDSDVYFYVDKNKEDILSQKSNELDCNRRTDWDLELETLCSIEDLLLRTEAILKEEESAIQEEKDFLNLRINTSPLKSLRI